MGWDLKNIKEASFSYSQLIFLLLLEFKLD